MILVSQQTPLTHVATYHQVLVRGGGLYHNIWIDLHPKESRTKLRIQFYRVGSANLYLTGQLTLGWGDDPTLWCIRLSHNQRPELSLHHEDCLKGLPDFPMGDLKDRFGAEVLSSIRIATRLSRKAERIFRLMQDLGIEFEVEEDD